MSEPVLAWLIRPLTTQLDPNALAWTTREPREAECAGNFGFEAVPLVAAPPEDGRPTYTELVEALRRVGDLTAEEVIGSDLATVRRLLSRIPKEEP